MSKMIEGRIECPFYLKEGDSFIACEGILNGTKCFHRFQGSQSFYTERRRARGMSLWILRALCSDVAGALSIR